MPGKCSDVFVEEAHQRRSFQRTLAHSVGDDVTGLDARNGVRLREIRIRVHALGFRPEQVVHDGGCKNPGVIWSGVENKVIR